MKVQILTAALASVAAANVAMPSFWPTEGLEHLNSEDGYTLTMYENMQTEITAIQKRDDGFRGTSIYDPKTCKKTSLNVLPRFTTVVSAYYSWRMSKVVYKLDDATMRAYWGKSDKATRDLVSNTYMKLFWESKTENRGFLRIACDFEHCENAEKPGVLKLTVDPKEQTVDVAMCPVYYSIFGLFNHNCKSEWLSSSGFQMVFAGLPPQGAGLRLEGELTRNAIMYWMAAERLQCTNIDENQELQGMALKQELGIQKLFEQL